MDWPDGQGGELELIVGLLLLEGHWECVALRIAAPEGAAPRALRTADLRSLGMTGIVAAAYDKLRDELSEAATQELAARRSTPSPGIEYRKRLLEQRRQQEALRAAGPKRAGRPRLSVDQLTEVAEVYAQAYAEQRPPRQAVADYFAISPTAAASRIAAARKAGLLGLSGRGRAGAGRLIHGSEADVLERLMQIKEFMAQRDAEAAPQQPAGGREAGPGAGESS